VGLQRLPGGISYALQADATEFAPVASTSTTPLNRSRPGRTIARAACAAKSTPSGIFIRAGFTDMSIHRTNLLGTPVMLTAVGKSRTTRP